MRKKTYQIARELGIAQNTVRATIARLIEKDKLTHEQAEQSNVIRRNNNGQQKIDGR